jgi:tRNA-guanine transglycosylase
MIEFNIQKQSKRSHARLGILTTEHGTVETPAFVPVATQAVIKTLTSEETLQTNSQLLIANTFHLHLKPGEDIIKAAQGLHKFMNWPKPIMTDSAGYQVFSLGFGKDHSVGKIDKLNSPDEIKTGQQPKLLTITDDGVHFTSPLDGKKIFIGPKESIKIQEALGADIIFTFDECTPPLADEKYTQDSLVKTHRWAKVCLDAKKSKQALFGIVQGGKFKNLRMDSAKYISSLPFDGFGVGGEFGSNKKTMQRMLDWTLQELPTEKPRHLLGIGHLNDIPEIIKAGVDTFDCIVPTHYARHGTAFTNKGKLDLSKSKYFKDQKPIDSTCKCFVCANYRRSYITHLLRAKEITGLKLLTFHNLFFFNNYVSLLREDIKNDKL